MIQIIVSTTMAITMIQIIRMMFIVSRHHRATRSGRGAKPCDERSPSGMLNQAAQGGVWIPIWIVVIRRSARLADADGGGGGAGGGHLREADQSGCCC